MQPNNSPIVSIGGVMKLEDVTSGMKKSILEMTNFDHSIDDGLADELKQNPVKVYAQHSAYEFCGYVWYEDEMFHENVWRYGQLIDKISADSLETLMNKVNSKYGSE